MFALFSLEIGYNILEIELYAFGNEFLTVIIIWFQARPTMYQVVKEMIEKMGYEVCFDSSFSFSTLSLSLKLKWDVGCGLFVILVANILFIDAGQTRKGYEESARGIFCSVISLKGMYKFLPLDSVLFSQISLRDWVFVRFRLVVRLTASASISDLQMQ